MEEELNLTQVKELNLKKYRAILLHQDGRSYNSIAQEVGLDSRTVSSIVHKFNEFGSVEYDLRSNNMGRSKLLSPQQTQQIIGIVESQQSQSFKSLNQKIRDTMDIECSDSTLRRELNEVGRFLIPQWVPKLTEKQIHQRIQFCKVHKRLKSSFLNVIFTDECRFYLNRTTKKVYVLNSQQRPTKAINNPNYSILVWAAICYSGKVNLQFITGNVNSEKYSEILKTFVHDGFQQIKEIKKWKFMQDGAPAHRPKIHKTYLKEQGISIHDHPANSPDLNPIETVWGYLKQQIEEFDPQTKDELQSSIQKVWNQLPRDVIQNCIKNLKQQVNKILNNDGKFSN